MATTCLPCEEITLLTDELDTRAANLTTRIVEFCRPVNERNKERWMNFAEEIDQRFFGQSFYLIYRGPEDLEELPEFRNESWFDPAATSLIVGATQLEVMKVADMVHWEEERVYAHLSHDVGSHYDHRLPRNPMRRVDAYKKYSATDDLPLESLDVSITGKYYFHGVMGSQAAKQESWVYDYVKKEVVPFNTCRYLHTNNIFNPKSPILRLSQRLHQHEHYYAPLGTRFANDRF